MSAKKFKYQSLLALFSAAAFCLLRLNDASNGMTSFGLFVGLLYAGNTVVPTAVFALTSLIGGADAFFVALSQAAVMVSLCLLHCKTKKKIGRWLLLLYIFLANVFFFAYKLQRAELFDRLVSLALGAVFCYVCIYAMRALFVRGLKYSLSPDEAVSVNLVLLAVFVGLTKITVFGAPLIKPFAPFIILFFTFAANPQTAFCMAATLGAASAVAGNGLIMAAVYLVWTACAVAFCTVNRYLSTFALLLGELITAYFFEVYGQLTTVNLVMTVCGCFAFCCVPFSLLKRARVVLGQDGAQYSPRHIINRLRINLSRRLFDLSEVFFCMQNTFKSLTRGVMPPQKAVYAISNQVADVACKDCSKRLVCWRNQSQETQSALNGLTACGIDRGRVTLLDVEPSLASKCRRISAVLSCVNAEVANYKQYYLVNSSYDNSRALLADVTEGISKVINNLSVDSRATLSFDSKREKLVMEQLTFFNVLTKEVAFVCNQKDISVTVVVDKKDADKPQIAEVVSKACGLDMCCKAKENLSGDNWSALYFAPKPRFDVSVGIASATKQNSEISGDTHTFLRLDNDKYLLGLCDGMGSGEQAQNASAASVSMVENFYRAGFDNDLILNCINKLMTAANTEVFTAVDIVVIDLKNGAADFIKLGAPLGVVKCAGEVRFVEGCSLPIGVLEEIKPATSRMTLGKNDLVLLASDGFWDSFSDKTAPAVLVDECLLTNPQLIAQNLVEQALASAGGVARDDITVMVAKIY